MSRLIDADELKEFWWQPESGMEDTMRDLADKYDLNDCDNDIVQLGRELLEIVNNVIDTQPTVDEVEVTYCKDCWKRDTSTCPMEYIQLTDNDYFYCKEGE